MTPCALLLVLAQAGSPPDDLDELERLLEVKVVSGASRTQERADDAPATVTVVTAEELRQSGLRTLHEAISFLSNGLVAQDPNYEVEVGSRGLLLSGDFGSHLLVVIDGHALNEPWNGTAYVEYGLGLSLDAIDHLELIVGPGSVLYGSNAMLGVVNIVTKRAKDVGRLQLSVEGALLPPQGAAGSVDLRAGHFGGLGRAALLTGASATLAGQPFEVLLSAEYLQHQGQTLTFPVERGLLDGDGARSWPQRWGPRAPAPGSWGGAVDQGWWTQAPAGLLKASWGDVSLWLRGALYARGAPAYDSVFFVAADFDGPAKVVDRWLDAELRWSRTVSARLALLVRAYADLYDYQSSLSASSWSLFGSGDALPADLDPATLSFSSVDHGASRWAGLEAQGVYDLVGDGRFPLMVGVDARVRHFEHDKRYAVGTRLLFDANVYAADEWQVAVYAQQRLKLPEHVSLNLGARLDTQAAFAPQLSPRVALVWQHPWHGTLKASFTTAFRAPSGYERYTTYPAVLERNPALKPESVMSGEVGLEQHLGHHALTVTGFVANYANLVRLQPVSSAPGTTLSWYANQGAILNVGAQGQLTGSAGPLRYGLSLTGAVNHTDLALVASPSWFGNARLSYDFGQGLPTVTVLTAFSGPRLITTALASGTDMSGNPLGWSDAQRWVGPQAELRAVVYSALPVRGLWVRGVVSGSLTPFSAYAVGPLPGPEPQAGFNAPVLMPNSRLLVMVSLGWSLDGP